MRGICIRIAGLSDCDQLARLRAALWPEALLREHARELAAMLERTARPTMPRISVVAETSRRRLVGFLEVGLRSHADGCDPSHAVGFVEGWYVDEAYRRQGIGCRLLAAAEEWARNQGCRDMASDFRIENEVSQRVHEAAGFTVVDRCVHYRKPLCEPPQRREPDPTVRA